MFDLNITVGLTDRIFRVSASDLNNIFKLQYLVGGQDIIFSAEGEGGMESGLRLPASIPCEYTLRPVTGPEKARKHGLYSIKTVREWKGIFADMLAQQAMAEAGHQRG